MAICSPQCEPMYQEDGDHDASQNDNTDWDALPDHPSFWHGVTIVPVVDPWRANVTEIKEDDDCENDYTFDLDVCSAAGATSASSSSCPSPPLSPSVRTRPGTSTSSVPQSSLAATPKISNHSQTTCFSTESSKVIDVDDQQPNSSVWSLAAMSLEVPLLPRLRPSGYVPFSPFLVKDNDPIQLKVHAANVVVLPPAMTRNATDTTDELDEDDGDDDEWIASPAKESLVRDLTVLFDHHDLSSSISNHPSTLARRRPRAMPSTLESACDDTSPQISPGSSLYHSVRSRLSSSSISDHPNTALKALAPSPNRFGLNNTTSSQLQQWRPLQLRLRRRSDGSCRYPRNSSKHRSPRNYSPWIPGIPSDHPLKLLWDVLTVLLSLGNAYATHSAIRDRNFQFHSFRLFCDVWFLLDILLNFVAERPIGNGIVLRDFRSICARYLTTWFVIDLLALVPAELLYIQPIIEQQNKRKFWQKYLFRTKAVVRITTAIRSRHVQWFGQVARHTKRAGMTGGTHRLLRLLIRYVPKYLLFFRTMKGVLAIRLLRQIHWCRRIWFQVVALIHGTTQRLRQQRRQRLKHPQQPLYRFPRRRNFLSKWTTNLATTTTDGHHVDNDDDRTHSTADAFWELEQEYSMEDDAGNVHNAWEYVDETFDDNDFHEEHTEGEVLPREEYDDDGDPY